MQEQESDGEQQEDPEAGYTENEEEDVLYAQDDGISRLCNIQFCTEDAVPTVDVYIPGQQKVFKALIDTGASGDFISEALVKELKLQKRAERRARALDRRLETTRFNNPTRTAPVNSLYIITRIQHKPPKAQPEEPTSILNIRVE